VIIVGFRIYTWQALAARLLQGLTMKAPHASPRVGTTPTLGHLPLKGNLAGHWSVSVSGNWRLTFLFEGEDAILVDYQDYH
jgi:proteic killer suppression protein